MQNSSDVSLGGHRKVFYSLVVFDCKIDQQTANVIRVDVHCEVTPNIPESNAGNSFTEDWDAYCICCICC